MDSKWVEEHLQTIRTLMERSALYRRALAPVMTFAGALGLVGCLAGCLANFDTPRAFVVFWAGVAAAALIGSFLLVRRQALKDAEPFWSPPTQRVVHAMLPALLAGMALGIVAMIIAPASAGFNVGNMRLVLTDKTVDLSWLPLAWVVLYGCALHSAGFFTPSGLRLFGWLFVLAGCGLLIGLPLAGFHPTRPQLFGHLLMGGFFGALHLAYGGYLYLTEKGKNGA